MLGLEEDKITWHSNYYHTKTSPLHGLEEKEIAVTQTLENHECAGLGKDEITWYLNWHTRVFFGLEEDEITWYSNKQNFVRKRNKALEKSKIAWFSDKQGPIFFAYISA